MSMRRPLLIATAVSLSLISACKKAEQAPANDTATSNESAPAPAGPAPATIDSASWAGKWTGPEGMYLTVTPGSDGKITLEMQSDLDTKATYKGTATADGISFKRGEETLTLKQSTGDQTGLKYLADKKDCLMVKSGEGYCRD
jgi:hypothetical protein